MVIRGGSPQARPRVRPSKPSVLVHATWRASSRRSGIYARLTVEIYLVSMARVLIVDDDGDFRGAVAAYLNADGFEVVEAEDGVDALEQARRTAPTAVLLDII